MVNELRELLRSNVESSPQDPVDLSTVLRTGRRRVRRRRLVTMGGAALASVAVVGAASTTRTFATKCRRLLGSALNARR